VVNPSKGVNAMQRRLTIASTIALISLLILPIAFATTTPKDIIVKNDAGEDGASITVASGGSWQTFKIPQKCKIEVVELYLMKEGNITGWTLGFYYWNSSANTLGSKIYEQNFASPSSTYTKANYTLSTPVQLNSSAYTYALHIKPYGDSSALIGTRVDGDAYSGGSFWNYGEDTHTDMYFILYGELLIDPSAIVYQWLPTIFTIVMMGIAFGMLTKLMRQR
jgi:hypothetical protein